MKFTLVFSMLLFAGAIFVTFWDNEKGHAAPKGDIIEKEVVMDEKTLKEKLSSDQYHVMREEGTERPFSSALNGEKREGVYVCAACGQELFYSHAKYDSGTGWPSFTEPVEGALGTKVDYKLGYPRTEYHCAKCGSHLGHVFDDGPGPNLQRYCTNGVAMRFIPNE